MLKRLLVLSVGILLVGCARDNVPRTTITGDLQRGQFKISAPKDFEVGTLDVSSDKNGVVSVHLTQAKAVMNPQVIQASGAMSADVINSISTNAAILMEKGIAIGVKGAKAGAGIP